MEVSRDFLPATQHHGKAESYCRGVFLLVTGAAFISPCFAGGCLRRMIVKSWRLQDDVNSFSRSVLENILNPCADLRFACPAPRFVEMNSDHREISEWASETSLWSEV